MTPGTTCHQTRRSVPFRGGEFAHSADALLTI